MKKLGFGMMRLPVLNGEATNFDYEKINKMIDTFLAEGGDYFDYYLLHNLQTVWYDGIEGKGDGLFLSEHLFEHAKAWKAAGKIHRLGISFHSSPALLERVLKAHPEIEFVQIALNPIDWDSEFVAAKACYEIIRRYGKEVIVMEAVKGGGLAKLPLEAEKVLKDVCPDKSIASWSVRFACGLDGVIVALSGMSDLEQVKDNCKTANEAQAFSKEEEKALWKAMEIYRNCTPIPPAELEKYRGLTWNGVSVYAILQAYSICLVQPNQDIIDDNNYFKNLLAEHAHLDIYKELPKQKVVRADGMDATCIVEEAVNYLQRNTF